ncbi:MAG: hypothetical protein DRN15_03110 [Thermoprotei archaeon]|mgnify:CR=1 FL=1|nr:MAG: hypothetical protein DRN15_03110 [Thermoprotei archaeon]
MCPHEACIIFRSNPVVLKIVYSSIKPEAESQPRGGKVKVMMSRGHVVIEMSAEKLSVLRAMLTSYLRALSMLRALCSLEDRK